MESIDSVVVVNIDRLTQLPSRTGFGTPAVLDINVKQTNDFDIVTSITDLEDLGFVPADEAHKAVSALLSQSPKPEKVVVLKRATNAAQEEQVTVGGADDGTYTHTINGVDFSFVASSSTVTAIRDALVAAINGGAEPVTAAPVSTDQYTVTADNAGVGFSSVFTSNPNNNLSQVTNQANVGADTELSRLRELIDDFFFLIATSKTEQDILQLAAAVELLPKMYFTATDEADSRDLPSATDTTSIAGQLKALNYDQTALVVTEAGKLDEYKEAAWVGIGAPKDPGSLTWKFKDGSGITADDNLTTTQRANIKGKNANLYVTVGGRPQFSEGTVVSGEFIDIIRGTFFIQIRMQEGVFAVLDQEDKVPYTNDGIQQIVTPMRAVLTLSIRQQILVSFEIQAPNVADIPVADRAARILKTIEFTGVYAGAVHKVEIKGSLSV